MATEPWVRGTRPFRWVERWEHLREAYKVIRLQVYQEVKRAVVAMFAWTVSEAPVSPHGGRLKTSYRMIEPPPTGPIVGGVGTNVEYAPYVEFGTGRRGAASDYPYPVHREYAMWWPGMTARAPMAKAAKRVEPILEAELTSLGVKLPKKV